MNEYKINLDTDHYIIIADTEAGWRVDFYECGRYLKNDGFYLKLTDVLCEYGIAEAINTPIWGH